MESIEEKEQEEQQIRCPKCNIVLMESLDNENKHFLHCLKCNDLYCICNECDQDGKEVIEKCGMQTGSHCSSCTYYVCKSCIDSRRYDNLYWATKETKGTYIDNNTDKYVCVYCNYIKNKKKHVYSLLLFFFYFLFFSNSS